MSDKSFGDHTNRNIVKNPLLSSAVVGLSLEDLTHKAVLLPAAPSLDQITRSDQQQGSRGSTLAHPKHETSTIPFGDAFTNISLSNTPQSTNQNLLDSKKIVNLEENRCSQISTQPKASVKSDDDFDVNEYIARLQGTKYVSAPLHSHLKEDQNANMGATEESLEEINLNENSPVETQQSITADIAQNFSQLPTVLPHVASAVFSSFSNMLSYKSRDQTPDHPKPVQGNIGGFDQVPYQGPDLGVPLVGVEEAKAPREVAPPPMQPPIGGTTNFRITSKKKYAQIPGLSTGDAAQTMTFPPSHSIPPIGQNLLPSAQNLAPSGQNLTSMSQSFQPTGHDAPISQSMPLTGQYVLHTAHNVPDISRNVPPIGHLPPRHGDVQPADQNIAIRQNVPLTHSIQFDEPNTQGLLTHNLGYEHNFSQYGLPDAQNVPLTTENVGQSEQQNVQIMQTVVQDPQFIQSSFVDNITKTAEETRVQDNGTQPVAAKQPMYNIFNPANESFSDNKPVKFDNHPNLLGSSQNFFTPVEHKENVPSNLGNAAIIPPPPMFSNMSRRDSQASVGKSILPPSVARRISSNQPIIKPSVSTSSFSENIFVPAPLPDVTESGQPEKQFSSGVSSAFVPTYNIPSKSEQSPPDNVSSLKMTVQSNLPKTVNSAVPPSYLNPSNETKLSSPEVTTFFTPKETESTGDKPSSVTALTQNLPPVVPSSALPVVSSFGSSASVPFSNIASTNVSVAASVFIPNSIITSPQNAPPPIFQPSLQNVPPTFFNISQGDSSSTNTPHPITQMPPNAVPEPPKPVAEPPKASGNLNFRMTKKRPQYYAGPIEGVGSISNNVKPVIAPVIPSTVPEPNNFQGTFFTPEQPMQPVMEQCTAPNIEQASVPFDINKPVEQSGSVFEINKPQGSLYGSYFDMRQPESQNYDREYNTPFDMSRDPADSYNQPKQEPSGFGIIGSLKSKLSSIDINKIQNTVTTFFDPAYNDNKVDEPITHTDTSYQQQQHGQWAQGQSNFDIFVPPNVEQNQYGQYTRGHENQYHQEQYPYMQQQLQSQNVTNYFTNQNNPTEQLYASNLYDNTQIAPPAVSSFSHQNIPQKVDKISKDSRQTDNRAFYNPNAFTQDSMIQSTPQSVFDIHKNVGQGNVDVLENEKNVTYCDPSVTSSFSQLNVQQTTTSALGSEQGSMVHNNPNAFSEENRHWEPQQSNDSFVSLSQQFGHSQTRNVDTSEPQHLEPMFYSPSAFGSGNQQIPIPHQQIFNPDFPDNTDYKRSIEEHEPSSYSKSSDEYQINSQPSIDSVLNTSKYNFESMQTHVVAQNITSNVPLLPAASFFDNPVSTGLPQYSKNMESENKLTDVMSNNGRNVVNNPLTTTPFENKSEHGSLKDEENKFQEKEQHREENVIESIVKDNAPVLGVSTVPLFGLSTIVADKTKEANTVDKPVSSGTEPHNDLIENKSSASFFDLKEPDNKIINENQIPLDITALSINDVKNVLLIEPPQENIGSLLKRNASSNKLVDKNSQSVECHTTETTNKMFHDEVGLDERAADVFYKKIDTQWGEEKNEGIANKHDEHAELNICETCREVNTPEHDKKHNETEDLTSQLVDNITSKLQLSQPIKVPFIESATPAVETPLFDDELVNEITHVAEETYETLKIQSATELLNVHSNSEIRDYGWTTEEPVYPVVAAVDHDYVKKFDPIPMTIKQGYGLEFDAVIETNVTQDYEFKLDPNATGFFGNNSLFFDNVPMPTNASDEIKAEIKHSHEDIVLPRQMSIPTAPPEEDLKLDETGVLDVHSIEQDAKEDFPLEEEFIIEPSKDEFLSTDDDKIEFRERKRSSEDSVSNDTFTNRIEKFKKKTDNVNEPPFEQTSYGSPPISMASYFDTGNYAVESHFKNSLTNVKKIPPGFEEEFVRKLSGVSFDSSDNIPEPYIPDTTTQTRLINTASYSSPSYARENIIGYEMRQKENAEMLAQVLAGEPKLQTIEKTSQLAEHSQSSFISDDKIVHSDVFSQKVESSPNPTNFFSADVAEPKFIEPPTENISKLTTCYSNTNLARENLSDQEIYTKENAETLSRSSTRQSEVPTLQAIEKTAIGDIAQPSFTSDDRTAQCEVFSQKVQPLSDPMNFFSPNIDEPKITEPAAAESFSRLASYFAMAPVQPDPSKPFFELSQSQNHYRHEPKTNQKSFFELSQSQNHYMDDDAKSNLKQLMNDLTSPQNLKDNSVKNVNYFTIEMDNDVKHNRNVAPINISFDKINANNNSKIDNKKEPKPMRTDKYNDDIMNCEICRRCIIGVNTKFVVKTAVNEHQSSSEATMPSGNDNGSERTGSSVNFADFDVEKQANSNVTVTNEHRNASEYTPVKHHWFYRVDVEEKSVWRGFSNADSTALEEAFNSPDLNENTLVPTDGGRYDVNIVGRLRIAVYWKEKPTNVRRCSWFYKGTTDARYVPYTESVAEKLEESYRHGMTTGVWHQKLSLPNSELVIMHGPSVMVHFLHTSADAFSTPPQAASRPRVVRRSHEESEIEECEPSRIDHLLLLCHGVGSACDMRFRSLEEVVEDFRTTSLQLVQSHYRNSYDNGLVSRVEVLPISWHEQLHSGENGVDKRLARVTLDSIPRLRGFTNHTVLDVLFYTSPVFHQTIIDTVCFELNRVYSKFRARNPHFSGTVSLGGHSLGSVILYDLLCHQMPESPQESPGAKRYVSESAEVSGQPVTYPQLTFTPDALYALGSPIAIFECIRGVESLGMDFSLPTCKKFFNIFHPYDPIAYRIEPLINPDLQNVKPSLIPHHKGRKRMHLELKDTMARVGADLKQKLIESLRTTWNKWKSPVPTDSQLEKVVEEEMEKEQLTMEEEPAASEMQASSEQLGRLNGGRRVDYVLQEAPLEMINEYLFAMSSHVGYWESEDTMLLMLREIYDSLGVQPDSTVPQQSMTVQRTKTAPQDEFNKSLIEQDSPSTSRGST